MDARPGGPATRGPARRDRPPSPAGQSVTAPDPAGPLTRMSESARRPKKSESHVRPARPPTQLGLSLASWHRHDLPYSSLDSPTEGLSCPRSSPSIRPFLLAMAHMHSALPPAAANSNLDFRVLHGIGMISRIARWIAPLKGCPVQGLPRPSGLSCLPWPACTPPRRQPPYIQLDGPRPSRCPECGPD
jgi:hypothetical protein